MKWHQPLLGALALLLLGSCQPAIRITRANVNEVAVGMARKQVESILGMPTSVDTREFETKQRLTYNYVQPNGTVEVVFWEDRVESKATTLPE